MSMLPWLPLHEDLTGAIRDLRALDDPARQLEGVVRLAQHDRDVIATMRIDKLLGACLDALGPDGLRAAGLRPMRLAILPSHTVEHLVPAIRVAGLGRRLGLVVKIGGYGLHRHALLHGDAELQRFAPELVLLSLDYAAVMPPQPIGASPAEVDAAVDRAVGELRMLWSQVKERFGALPVQQLLLPTTSRLFGSFDALTPASPASLVQRLNLAIAAAAREEGALVLELAGQLPQRIDADERFDPVRWHHGKQLINPPFAPLYGDLVARLAAAVAGLSRKCLVLDLDNTLWGGVIGDDGIEGIRLGQGTAEGEAYAAFQRYATDLGARGIILAVCSKNDETVARSAFEQHPDMVLRLPEVACFTANWTDKPANLRAIADYLGIGLDSLVFVDDNPAERAIVRRELPQVAVPELPDDVSGYPGRIAAAGYFEAASFTEEDLGRSRSYAASAERKAMLAEATDMEGFLQSLDMRLIAREIGPVDLPRAAQLINKSNQYNLTTVRRTEQELRDFLSRNEHLAFCFRLIDRYGDNGLISVVLARPADMAERGELLIDTWLMSCRVLGRNVEAAVLECLTKAARSRNVAALLGEYRASGRNGMVADHYARLGFAPDTTPGRCGSDAQFWRLHLAGARVPSHHITVEMVG